MIYKLDWENSGKILQILVPWYFIGILTQPISMLMDVFQVLKKELYFNVLLLLFRIIAILLGFYFGTFYDSILFYSIVGVVFNLFFIYYVYNYIINDRN